MWGDPGRGRRYRDELTPTAPDPAAAPELKALTAQPKTEDARAALAALKTRNGERLARLAKLRGAEDQVSEADMRKTEAAYAAAVKEWRRRKRWAADMVDMIMESYPKKKKVLLEEIGVEDDEAAGVNAAEF